jgi:hypothetical protein
MILASYKIKCRNKFGIQISWLSGAAVCDRPQLEDNLTITRLVLL